jgi:putative ABC transport system ATP-binding protein
MTVLEAHDVTKTYCDGGHVVHTVRGVSLAVARDEVLAIEGPSGSGKTTRLCILGCLLTPNTGDGMALRFALEDPVFDAVRDRPEFRALRLDLGFPVDPFALPPNQG